MIVKESVLSFYLILTLISLNLFLSGCEHDYYQPKENEAGSGSSLFGDSITVPSTFSWATMRAVKVNVAVDDQYNGNYFYTVELYDSNPLFNTDATLLSKGVAKKNSDFSSSVVLPEALERVYVQQTDPTGKQAVKVIPISGESVGVNFGNITSASALRSASLANTTEITISTRAGTSDYDMPTREYPTPANATDITAGTFNGTLQAGQSYVIPAGKTYNGNLNFAWGDGASLYVEGTWNSVSGVALNHSQLIIQDGGEFNPGGNVSVNNSKIIVATAGKFNKENNPIDILNNNILQVINNGLFNAKEISKIQGVYNYGEMNFSGNLSSNLVNIVFVNEKTLTVGGNLTLNKNNKLYNYDTMSITGNLDSGSENTEILNNKSLTVGGILTLKGKNKLYNYDTMIIGKLAVNAQNIAIYSKRLTVGIINMNGSGSILSNSCQLIADEIILTSGITVNISEGSLLKANTVSLAGSSINLESHAILEVNQELKFTNSKSSINGPSSGEKALARLKKVTVLNWTDPSYGGFLEVECADHSLNVHPTPYTEGDNVTFVRDGSNSSLSIPATECNEGGNNTSSPGTPANPTFPIIYEGTDMTYLFEDNWPNLGDFDMNDLVLGMNPVYTTNTEGKVTQLQLEITLRAVGATKGLAVGLQLDGIVGSTISGVSRSNTAGVNGTVFVQSESNGLESGQTYAVIPVFDDVHSALGYSSKKMINTIKGSSDTATPLKVVFTLNFSSPVENASVTVDKFNMFIINGGYSSKRHEIHLSGFQPTDKADRSRFGSADDNSNNKLYTSKDNLIWGLAIPGSAKYPIEWTSIRLAYPAMESWATSGGESSKDWYKQAVENLVYTQ